MPRLTSFAQQGLTVQRAIIGYSLKYTLNNPENQSLDYFSFESVSISGDRAIVGGYAISNAYIFDLISGNTLHTLNVGSNTRVITAISGNYAIVGCPLDSTDGVGSGRAFIYDVTTGSLLHTLTNPNPFGTTQDDLFGARVAIDGDFAIVGAYQEDDASGTSSGKAYIFDVTTGSLLHTLDNPNPVGTSDFDIFGAKVAIAGNYAVVSAYQEDDIGANNSGKVYIYNVTTGSLIRTLNNPNAYGTPAGDTFGRSIAIDGDFVIVGANQEDDASGTNSGKAYIFDVTTGSLLHTLDNPNPVDTADNDEFGKSVAISGSYAVVGAPIEDDADGNLNSGKVYIFNVTTGSLLQTLNNPNAYNTSFNDRFGQDVAIDGDFIIVGAEAEDASGVVDTGKAYIYQKG